AGTSAFLPSRTLSTWPNCARTRTADQPLRWEDDLLQQVVLALERARGVLDDLEAARRRGKGAACAGEPGIGRLTSIDGRVFAETAMLLYAVAPLSATHVEIGVAATSVAERLAPLSRGPDVQAALCLDPGRALDHAASHVLLSALGRADASFDALLQA